MARMEALRVKYSFHYKAPFTVTHYFLIDISFVPHFFMSDLCPEIIFMKKKRKQLSKIYSIIFLVSVPKKQLLYTLQSKLFELS